MLVVWVQPHNRRRCSGAAALIRTVTTHQKRTPARAAATCLEPTAALEVSPTMALSSDAPDAELTPGEIRELSEEIPSESPVECMECGRTWSCGTDYVEQSLRELRMEWERIQAERVEDPRAAEGALRWALYELSGSTESLLEADPFELLTHCGACYLWHAKEGQF